MKKTAQKELLDLDLGTIIEKMDIYATRRLQNVDVKQLEGKTPEDFTQDVILKVLEGVRDWENAETQSMTKFLFGCLRSEINNFMKKIGRRGVSIVGIEEEYYDFEGDGITYANTKDSVDDNPKGYNNWDDEKIFYTDSIPTFIPNTGKAIGKPFIKK